MRNHSRQSADILQTRVGDGVDIGVMIGARLDAIAECVTAPVVVDYRELPGFPAAAPGGPPHQCVIGMIGPVRVAIFRGRAHYRDSGDIHCNRVLLETLKLLGASAVVLTGAVGSLKKEVGPGAFVVLRDHINLTGINPLIGGGDDDGAIDLSNAYDPGLRDRFVHTAAEAGRKITDGTLMWFPGPHFETPAETHAARLLGADIVGMSIVPDTVIARQLRLRVLAVTTVTNFAAGLNPEPLGPEQSLRVSSAAAPALSRVFVKLFERWTSNGRR